MKDKKKTNLRIQDIVEESKVKQSNEAPSFEHITFKFDEEFDNKLKAYNKSIADFNEAYSKAEPVKDIVCRVYANPLTRTPGGMIIPNQAPIQVATKSGVGQNWIDDPFSFTSKAIVVSVPKGFTQLKQGDIVALAHGALQKQVIGNGKEAEPIIANSFIHPDLTDLQTTPKDPEDINYGYFFIEPYKITIKLN